MAQRRLQIWPRDARDAEQGRAAEGEAQRLRGEVSALRRIALVVARAGSESELLDSIAGEIAQLLGTEDVRIFRYEADREAVVVAARGDEDHAALGSRHRLGGTNATSAVFRTRQPARVDDVPATATGAIAQTARRVGLRSVVAAPIMVAGRLWGAITVGSRRVDRLPADTETRLAEFTELTATAIANAESRVRGDRLADERAALQRVATLVARDVALSELCAAVVREAGTLMGADFGGMLRFDDERSAATMATWAATGEHPPIPERWAIEPGDPMTMIMATGEPARVDDWTAIPGPLAQMIRQDIGARSSVGCSIIVEGEVWGGLAVHRTQRAPLAPDTESRLRNFADLVATAIANQDARAEVARLAQEQAALRRVATLVARGTGPETVFRAVADEVGALMGCDTAAIVRFETDGWATVMGAHRSRRIPGARFQPEAGYVVAAVQSTGRAARFDTDDPAAADMPDAVRAEGIRSGLAAPIIVDDNLWGTITVASLHRPLPETTERRLADFTELVATAISNTQARGELHQLADTQGALRRVATLVASEASQAEVFTAIADECAALFAIEEARMMRYEEGPSEVVVAASGSTPDLFPVGSHHRLGGENATTRVFRTGRPARLDDFPTTATGPIGDAGRSSGIRSVVATPITVAGRLWGAMTMATRGDPPPPHTESSLAEFTELMATAIANTESRARADRLAGEQAGLRRLATLVAQEAPLAEVFARVAEEVARTAGDVDSALWRDDGDGTVTAVAVRGPGPAPGVSIGTKLSLDGDSVIAQVLREGRPHRIDDYSPLTGSIAERARALGLCSAVGCPIAVGSRTWGVMTVATHGPEPFAPETETRVARFSDLVATAIANAEARKEVERLAAEQAALRRVATLVAEEQSPAEVFAKVAEEAAKVLENVECAVLRDSGNDSATVVAALGAGMSARFPVGTRLPTDGDGVLASALRDGWPQRIEYGSAGGATAGAARELGISSAVATPIAAREWIWGAIVAARFDGGSCPPDTETRLAQFADLVATAIANVDARAQVERLAEEQAALRRVAMLAAAGASSTAVLDAVAAEMEALLDADQVTLTRFEPGDDLLVLANRGREMARTPVGSRVSIEGDSAPATVRRTGRPARMEGYASAEGAIAEIARDTGLRSSVSAPISVEGGLWGVITASWKTEEPPPPETEERMVKFAEVLDTAIANAETRDQLTASRARLVTAGDEARRQVVRDLHDGAQQRLVHAIVTLKLAQRALRQEDERTEALLGEALEHAEQGNEELRELAHGILPAVLTRGGLRAGVNALVARLDLPVRVQVSSERLPAEIEASAYFLVAEALTNVMKHAHAARAGVTASVEDGVLRLEVRDDGIGGADIGGHGLVGMADRVSAHGGQLSVDSPEDAGTLVTATLPLSTDGAASFSGQEAITPAPRAARAAAPARARRAR